MGRKPIKSDQAQLLFEGFLAPGETITASQPERNALVREAKGELSFASDLSLRQMKLLTYLLAMAAEKGERERSQRLTASTSPIMARSRG
jgi:hypothetical protein